MNKIGLIIITFVILFIIYCKINNYYNDCNSNNKEDYTPIIQRTTLLTKSQNECEYPYTNNKKDEIANKCASTSQYATRLLKPADKYLDMVSKLLADLSTKNINVSKIDSKNLVEKDYLGDPELLTNYMNTKINELIKTKEYLQQNGSWKYEYFYTKEPNIYYYSVSENGNHKYNLFKIIYTLANPLRSSYTSCLAFITEINNKLEIQYTTFVNDINLNNYGENNLNIISKESLNFKFLDRLAELDFDKYGITTDSSGLNYLDEYTAENKIEVKADIPDEFKKILIKT